MPETASFISSETCCVRRALNCQPLTRAAQAPMSIFENENSIYKRAPRMCSQSKNSSRTLDWVSRGLWNSSSVNRDAVPMAIGGWGVRSWCAEPAGGLKLSWAICPR
jgi:hypothetical protein